MNDTINVIKNHTTIRKFNDLKITESEEHEILDCALRGATAGNMMLYSIIKIKDENTLYKLSVLCDNQPFIKNCGFGLVFLIDTNKYEKYFEYRGIKKQYKDYKGATSADFILGVQDAVISAQNAVVCAESMDIGTCYIGDIVENKEEIQKLLNLPFGTMPISFVVFGKFDTKPKLRQRFSKEFVVFDEKYPNIDENFINKMFEKEEKSTPDFADKIFNRKMGASFFKEMIRSCDLYIKQWFNRSL